VFERVHFICAGKNRESDESGKQRIGPPRGMRV
jgi:hypothetical protein